MPQPASMCAAYAHTQSTSEKQETVEIGCLLMLAGLRVAGQYRDVRCKLPVHLRLCTMAHTITTTRIIMTIGRLGIQKPPCPPIRPPPQRTCQWDSVRERFVGDPRTSSGSVRDSICADPTAAVKPCDDRERFLVSRGHGRASTAFIAG